MERDLLEKFNKSFYMDKKNPADRGILKEHNENLYYNFTTLAACIPRAPSVRS